jgi:hypothetical protein
MPNLYDGLPIESHCYLATFLHAQLWLGGGESDMKVRCPFALALNAAVSCRENQQKRMLGMAFNRLARLVTKRRRDATHKPTTPSSADVLAKGYRRGVAIRRRTLHGKPTWGGGDDRKRHRDPLKVTCRRQNR